ncbi:MAG: DNA polymerase III subunit alpha [Chlorobi bacterium]|nr:DNA polymerase III subunit alpha [Chlorobiota bacterium]
MYLNTHTYYSFRYGTMKPVELLAEAKKCGVTKFALTDINSTSACLNFTRLAPDYNIEPVLGIDFRNGAQQQFIGIAKNNEGFKELNDFLSAYLHAGKKIPDTAPPLKNAYIIYPFSKFKGQSLQKNEFIGIHPLELTRLKFSDKTTDKSKLVILQTVTFRHKRDFNAHRLLRAIDTNTLLSKLSKYEEGKENDVMFSQNKLLSLYNAFPEIIENTQKLLESCSISFAFGPENPPKNKKIFTASEKEDFRLLQQLCREGITYRYPNTDEKILLRVQKELEVIQQKNFVSYFLINWDIVSYARRKGYFYVGRGSGANSIVAYLLRITDVDPIELDLYFERFINLYRKSPPDFDIDFSWKDRDDITRYIFNRFPNVALLATYNTFQFKAVVHELGKVFGLPKHEIDLLSNGKYDYNKLDHLSKLVIKYGKLIHGFPNHLSIHAGGILISEKPIHYYTATSLPPKGYATTQFDMIIAEDIGLYKFDILSQRGLGKIKDAIDIIHKNNPESKPIDIHDIKKFKEDKRVKHLLKNALAIGCFYVESPAMRMLLKKLEVEHYLGLVAASSVIRPGVARSGMMREYILRFRYPERRKEAHPVLLNIMPETFGVMVYQEDVIKVAHYFAGLSLSEADVLRRGMSGKFRSRKEFDLVRDKFFANCRQKQYNNKLAIEVWKQIESFAGYAFAKGHSASYAVESFQSLYLKAYYPREFMVAVINNFGGFYRTEFYVHEARMWGANIHAPCVNKSKLQTTIYGKDIYLGFMLLHGLEANTATSILTERTKNGIFIDFNNFLERVSISLEQIRILIRIDAFNFTKINKKELLWEAHFKIANHEKRTQQMELFRVKPKNFTIPKLLESKYEDAFDQMELLGFSLYNPFMLLVNYPENNLSASHLPKYLGKIVTVWGYLVAMKITRTIKNDTMFFGTFLDQQGTFIDTTHFPDVAKNYPFKGRGVYAITGKVVEEFDFYSLEVIRMLKEPIIEDPRYSEKKLPLIKQLVDEFYISPPVN